MINLRTEHLLFALGYCLGLQLWSICNQIVLLGFCVLVLLVLLNIAQHKHDDHGGQDLRFSIPQLKEASGASPSRVRALVYPNHQVDSTRTPSQSAISDGSQRSEHACNTVPAHDYYGHRMTLEPYRFSTPIQRNNAGFTAGMHSNDAFSQVDMSVSSSSHQASESACSFFLRTSPSERRTLRRPNFLNRAERAVVLDWLQDVGKDKSQKNLPEITTLFSPALPLTARRLAHHLSTAEGGLHTCQARIHAAGCSSSSDPIASDQNAELCRFLLPAKRTKMSHDSTATSYTPTLRKAKMTKRDHSLQVGQVSSADEVMLSVDDAEGACPDLQSHESSSSTPHQISQPSTAECGSLVDDKHDFSGICSEYNGSPGPAESYSSYEVYDKLKEDEETLKKILHALRSERQSAKPTFQFRGEVSMQLDPPSLPDPCPIAESKVEAAPFSHSADAEEPEDTIRLISPKKRVSTPHAVANTRILELAAKLNS